MVLVATAFIVKEINDTGFNVWLQKRIEDGPLNDFLEMPGGKIENFETPSEALLREVKEETEFSLSKEFLLFKIYPHQYRDRKVALYTFLVNGDVFQSDTGEWFHINWNESFDDWNILEANFKIFNEIRDYLKKNYKAGLTSQIWKS